VVTSENDQTSITTISEWQVHISHHHSVSPIRRQSVEASDNPEPRPSWLGRGHIRQAVGVDHAWRVPLPRLGWLRVFTT
jgi:hypothetical protein